MPLSVNWWSGEPREGSILLAFLAVYSWGC